MLETNECSSWYNSMGNFLKHQFGIGEKEFYTAMDQHAWPDRTPPLHSAWSMALSAMTVDCEPCIHLFQIDSAILHQSIKKQNAMHYKG